MNKYIIKNCPVNYGLYKEMCGFVEEHEDTSKKCQDCTDCVMKQIVELCKETCRKRCTNNCLGKKKYCGYGQILQKLDIQEVE